MNAKYFYNELISGNHNFDGYLGWYKGHEVFIQETTTKEIFSVNANGEAYNCDSWEIDDVNELEGDFELFSYSRVTIAGYILLPALDYQGIIDKVKELFEHISEAEKTIPPLPVRNISPRNIWTNPAKTSFAYTKGGLIDVSVCTIPELCRMNLARKRAGKTCLPFDKTIEKQSAVYVTVSSYLDKDSTYEKIANTSRAALEELLADFPYGNWQNMRLSRYIYE